MPGEWYRAVKVDVLVGLPRLPTDGLLGLDQILQAAGVYDALRPVLDAHTVREPLHVGLADQGYTDPAATPPLVELPATAVQIDAGLNEIPRATCALAVGRDATALAAGVPSAAAVSVVHVLERYLDRHVPARVYVRARTVAAAGAGDLADNAPYPDEWVLAFDGFTTGPTHRAADGDARAVLHLTHFTGALAFSSTLSKEVHAGSAIPATLHVAAFPQVTSGVGLPLTPFGAASAALAGGPTLYADFWGYQVPAGVDGRTPQNLGVKGFLDQLARTDLFAWDTLRRSDLNARACTAPLPVDLKNYRALFALARIEPKWPDWAALVGSVGGGPVAAVGGRPYAQAVWDQLKTAGDSVRAVRQAGASTRAVDRADLIAQAGQTYYTAGYRYGVPLQFYLVDTNLGPFSQGRGFAMDVAGATAADLGPASFWDLIAVRYPARYQIALAPMADRAVVIPAQPILDGRWQFVYASEVFGWDDDLQTPIPVRGVILPGDRASLSGAFAGGFRPVEAAYDSCQPGVFVTRDLPPWLMTAYRAPGIAAAGTLAGPKAAAGAPWTTAPAAAAAVGGQAFAAAVAAPGSEKQTTANRLAQAFYQQERLRYKSVYLTGRFRHDVGPGSILTVEVPADRYVRAALAGGRDATVTGMVLRVTLTADAESGEAATSFQLGFVRTFPETRPGQPLYADTHPFWRTCVYGIPWADSRWVRDKLAGRATIADEPFNGGG